MDLGIRFAQCCGGGKLITRFPGLFSAEIVQLLLDTFKNDDFEHYEEERETEIDRVMKTRKMPLQGDSVQAFLAPILRPILEPVIDLSHELLDGVLHGVIARSDRHYTAHVDSGDMMEGCSLMVPLEVTPSNAEAGTVLYHQHAKDPAPMRFMADDEIAFYSPNNRHQGFRVAEEGILRDYGRPIYVHYSDMAKHLTGVPETLTEHGPEIPRGHYPVPKRLTVEHIEDWTIGSGFAWPTTQVHSAKVFDVSVPPVETKTWLLISPAGALIG